MQNAGHLSDERLDEIVADAATPTDTEQRHLVECHRCSQLLAAYTAVSTALSKPWTSTANVEGAGTRDSRRVRRPWLRPVASLTASALLTIAISAVLVVTRPVAVGESPSPRIADASPTHAARPSPSSNVQPSASPGAPTQSPFPSPGTETASPGRRS